MQLENEGKHSVYISRKDKINWSESIDDKRSSNIPVNEFVSYIDCSCIYIWTFPFVNLYYSYRFLNFEVKNTYSLSFSSKFSSFTYEKKKIFHRQSSSNNTTFALTLIFFLKFSPVILRLVFKRNTLNI